MVATDTERGPLMPRPTTAPATAMAAMVDTAVVFTDTARGLLMPRPTTAMAALAATAMAAMVDTAVVFTDTARGLLMPRPTTAMAALAATDTDTARGPLMPTTAAATAMAVTVTAVATPGASKSLTICQNLQVCNNIHTPKLSSQNIIHNSAARKIDGCVSFNKHHTTNEEFRYFHTAL